MSSREKHIEYSSNVVRTLNPSVSPRETEFDNKIDYLLEDLQQSVSRPGSSLGHNSTSNFSTMSSSNRDRDVQYFTSPNSSTKIIRERSVSPTSGRRTFKTAKYEYSNSTSGGMDSGYNTTNKVNVENSINQLDSLLDELKVERDLGTEPTDHLPITNTGFDSGILEPGHNSRTIQSSYSTKSTSNSLRPVPRELRFDSPTQHETPRVRELSPGYKKIVETTTTKNVNYDPYIPEKLESSVLDTITRSVNQTAKTLKPVNETVNMDPALDLEGMPMQGNILPPPGTKVTTTVRTYTYEIPGGENLPHSPGSHSVVYNTMSSHNNTLRSSTNQTLDRHRPERDVPPPGENTTIYRNETYTNNNSTNYLPEHRYPESDRPTLPRPGPGKNVKYISETYNNTTTNNVNGPEVDRPFPVPARSPTEPPVNKTVIYKRNVRDTSTTNYPGPNNRPTSPANGYPPNTHVEIYNEDITNNHVHPSGPNYPNEPNGPNGYPDTPKTTYYYKHESSNTTNRRYGPPGSANPPRNNEPQPIMMTPVNDSPYPREPGSVTYKYSTHTTSKNVNHGPDETDHLLKPFPTPVQPPRPVNISSPQRLEDLLSNFDDIPQKKGYHEQNMLPNKPYTASPDSLVETASPDQKVPTKNVAGPPVYYPPGEVTLRRSEKGEAMQAGGGYARGGGKYAYEAESKSKSKSSSGAAMVPVCLPLCCAMPCSIM